MTSDQAGPEALAGWYSHPSMADTRRYWDGQRWTDHIAPADVSPPAPTDAAAHPASRIDPSFAWALALLPLASIPIYYLVPTAGGSTAAALCICAVGVALAVADSKRLKAVSRARRPE